MEGEERSPGLEAFRPPRGAPLVATPGRWLVATTALVTASAVLVAAYLRLWPSGLPLGSLAGPVAAVDSLLAAVLWAMLRGEELRLGRELRTARTGTSALRGMVVRRRGGGGGLSRLLAARLGTAALFLADGDRAGAVAALAAESPLLRGGRLDALREVVDADLDRATGTPAGIGRGLERLQAMAAIGNREADLYRTHVLVKTVLERGDAEAALAVGEALAGSRDEEERVYLAWLGAWFEGDDVAGARDEGDARESRGREAPWTPASEGELRMAALLARAHGADKLVERIEARLAAIAPALGRK